MNLFSCPQKIQNNWKQSLISSLIQHYRQAWYNSRVFCFLTGSGLPEQYSFFQDTLTSRALTRCAHFPASLLRQGGELITRFAAGSIGWQITTIILQHSYVTLYLVGAYPLIDYFLRNTPALAGFAGIWDELLLLLAGTLLLTRFATAKEMRYFFTPLDLPLLLFLGTGVLLYLVRSPEPEVALDGMRATFQYVFWYFLAANLALNHRQRRSLFWGFVLAGAAVALYGVCQYIAGVPTPPNWVDQAEAGVRTRVFSWIGSPNVLGSYLVLLLPITAALLQTTRAHQAKLVLGAVSLAMLACLIFTFSRGAWLAFLAAALTYGLLQNRRILALILVGAILLPAVSPPVANRLQYTFSSKYIESSQHGGRFARWEEALNRVTAHPVTGAGLGRFGGATAARYNIPGTFYVDNYYLKLAVETGLLGLGVFLWLLLNVVRLLSNIIRELAQDPHTRALACGITAGLFGVLVHNFVENIFEVPMMQTMFWVLLGLATQLLSPQKAPRDPAHITSP